MATQTTAPAQTTVKSGKGISDGVVSELTAFFTVAPGQAEELRAACQRFSDALRAVDPVQTRKIGLRDSRMVIFDNDQRLLWTTTFETDWDPYLDDALLIMGVDHFIDWMRYVGEAEELRAWLMASGGPDTFRNADEQTIKSKGGGLKKVIQSVQVPATCYFNLLSDQTMPQMTKAQRVERAFQQVLDDPAAGEALQHPALKPLLEQAAD